MTSPRDFSWKGLSLAIQTAAGQYRSGVGKDGKSWRTKLHDHYGDVKGTEGADGDPVDVFLRSDSNLSSELVFLVNQVDKDGKFDEVKVVLGCTNEAAARATYLRNYEPGWTGLGSIRAMTLPDFKSWLSSPSSKKQAADPDEPFMIAVDLDGTLAEQEEPFDPKTVGKLRKGARRWLTLFRRAGARIIIFTVRGDKKLVGDWLAENRVPFDHLNENPDQPPNSSGKVFAHMYWDDRAYNARRLGEYGPTILAAARRHAKKRRGKSDVE